MTGHAETPDDGFVAAEHAGGTAEPERRTPLSGRPRRRGALAATGVGLVLAGGLGGFAIGHAIAGTTSPASGVSTGADQNGNPDGRPDGDPDGRPHVDRNGGQVAPGSTPDGSTPDGSTPDGSTADDPPSAGLGDGGPA